MIKCGCNVFIIQNNIKTGVFLLQGFPEFGDDEIVSVPDAKYTKGEFEVFTLFKKQCCLQLVNTCVGMRYYICLSLTVQFAAISPCQPCILILVTSLLLIITIVLLR